MGKAVPSHLFVADLKELQAYFEAHPPLKNEPGGFLTTDWEVLPDTPPDNVHFIMEMVSKD